MATNIERIKNLLSKGWEGTLYLNKPIKTGRFRKTKEPYGFVRELGEDYILFNPLKTKKDKLVENPIRIPYENITDVRIRGIK